MDEGTRTLVLLVVLAISMAVYFIPTWVAFARNHRQMLAIVILNALLGWTLIGWAGALVWACTKPASVSILTPEGV
jgi:hypothetical protein